MGLFEHLSFQGILTGTFPENWDCSQKIVKKIYNISENMMLFKKGCEKYG